jgi:hypothetical protein
MVGFGGVVQGKKALGKFILAYSRSAGLLATEVLEKSGGVEGKIDTYAGSNKSDQQTYKNPHIVYLQV